jgi:hypothetical protein
VDCVGPWEHAAFMTVGALVGNEVVKWERRESAKQAQAKQS